MQNPDAPLRPVPSEGELHILRVLWDHGPSTVRQVHGRMARQIGYTTVLKLLQIMTEKQLVTRDESSRSHVYTAAQPAQVTQRQLLRKLVDQAFAGSAAQLVLQALSSEPASTQELREIRKLLDEHDAQEPQKELP